MPVEIMFFSMFLHVENFFLKSMKCSSGHVESCSENGVESFALRIWKK